MATAKTFKLEQATIDKLQDIASSLGMTWDETFSALSALYEQNQQASHQGRTAEMKQFQALLQQLADSYTAALAYNATAEDRIRQEYAARIMTSEQAVESLKERAQKAEQEKDKADVHVIEMDGKVSDLTKELKGVSSEYMEYQRRAEQKAKEDASSITETKRNNEVLQRQVTNLAEQVDSMKEKVASVDAVNAELAKVRDEARQSAVSLDAARKEIETLKKELADAKAAAQAREQELKGRYDERAENAKQAAENDKQKAVLAEREQAAARAQERIDKMQEQVDKATARADEWQEKYYALKEQN